jgi:hypothetical protein
MKIVIANAFYYQRYKRMLHKGFIKVDLDRMIDNYLKLGYLREHIYILTDLPDTYSQPCYKIFDQQQYCSVVNSICQKHSNDVITFYFTGHGYRHKKKDKSYEHSLMLPHHQLGVKYLRMKDLAQIMNHYNIQLYCILDCCHAGGLLSELLEHLKIHCIALGSCQAEQISGFYFHPPYGSLFSYHFFTYKHNYQTLQQLKTAFDEMINSKVPDIKRHQHIVLMKNKID